MTGGRGWAYAGAGLGAVVSIAANVAHSYVPPSDAAEDWSPHAGAVIGAVFWPVALLVAVEIISRVTWPSGLRWTLLRYVGLLPVAGVAALVSYGHLSGLLGYYGEGVATARLGPLAVDGLMVMATAALIATAGHTRPSEATAAIVHTSEATPIEPQAAVTTVEPQRRATAATEPTAATPKRDHIIAALTTTSGNVAAARQLLAERGISAGREYVYKVRREAWPAT